MRRRRAAIPLASAALALAICIDCASVQEATRPTREDESQALVRSVSDGRYLMGTVLDITLLGDDEAALRAALAWSFDRVAALEHVASRHRPDSELNGFNARATRATPMRISDDLRALLLRSRAAGAQTRGAFDVTVGPLVELWWRSVERGQWPVDPALDEARSRVDFEAIELDANGQAWLSGAGRSVDLGGIAKGYALDVVKAELDARGIRRGLLDFGGSSVWALGHAPDGGPWRLEVDAREAAGPPRVLELVDRALSVSSSLGQSSLLDGHRIGHVIDPRSGRPVEASRTALALGGSATEAEVWSTALLVLPPEEGIELAAKRKGLEVWLRTESGEIRATPGFEPAWSDSPGRVGGD